MKKNKFKFILILMCVISFSVCSEESKGDEKEIYVNKNISSNLVCTPKKKFRATILSGFSLTSVYNPDKVRIWHGSPSKFIPTNIRKDEMGVEIMKGAMFGATRRQSRVEFKDSSKYTYDIYTPKNEWNCVANHK